MNPPHKAITLIELIVSIIILSLVVIGLSNIDTFSNLQVITSDRRAKLQHDASLVLEHMNREIARAIGQTNQVPPLIDPRNISGDVAIKVWVDENEDARVNPYPTDRYIAYRFTGATANPNDRYQIWYYSNCVVINPSPNCQPGSSNPEVISRQISNFAPTYSSVNNYIDMQVISCWDPDGLPNACGTVENPRITMQNRINMPSVSVN